jgi:hypothetical protein
MKVPPDLYYLVTLSAEGHLHFHIVSTSSQKVVFETNLSFILFRHVRLSLPDRLIRTGWSVWVF